MKRLNYLKIAQLVIYVILTIVCICKIFLNGNVFHQIANDSNMLLLCGLLWAVLGISFIFMFIDFRYFLSYQKEYIEMNYAIHSDPLSGIANRYSCDIIIEQYLDKPLPENMGCINFDLTNIQAINKNLGHVEGNVVIKAFSDILTGCANDKCFVGRNGGNKFIAIFESTTEEEMMNFLNSVEEKVKGYNNIHHAHAIRYRVGAAYHEGNNVSTITDLIALSSRRAAMTKGQ